MCKAISITKKWNVADSQCYVRQVLSNLAVLCETGAIKPCTAMRDRCYQTLQCYARQVLSNLFDFWCFNEVLIDSLLNLGQIDPADKVIFASQLRHSDNTNNDHNYHDICCVCATMIQADSCWRHIYNPSTYFRLQAYAAH